MVNVDKYSCLKIADTKNCYCIVSFFVHRISGTKEIDFFIKKYSTKGNFSLTSTLIPNILNNNVGM